MAGDGWSALFASAFMQSRNPMVLVDGERGIVDANGAFVRLLGRPRRTLLGHRIYSLVAGGPLATAGEWLDALAQGRFSGEASLLQADGTAVGVQWGACTEVATGRRLVLFVVLSTSRWGARFRRPPDDRRRGPLSVREREVVERVRTHVHNAMTKLGARSRAHLVAKALAEGLVER